MTKRKFHINPAIFFLFANNKPCLWNYADHEQFEINQDLFSLLCDISHEKDIPESDLLTDLLENNIVQETPYSPQNWGWDQLSHIFHVGTKNVPELQRKRTKEEMIKDFIGFSKEYAERKVDHTPLIHSKKLSLSKVDSGPETLSLVDSLKRRMTSRHFSGDSISEKDFSTLLYYTFGEIHDGWDGLEEDLSMVGIRKSSPGAGGIHSIQAYVTVFSVDGIESGLYQYDATDHTLTLVHTTVSWEKMIPLMADQFYMEGLAFGVFMVSNLERVWAKYLHSRAYREIFLDAGHLSQTLQLLATSLSLNTWISGYFRDDDLMDFLEITNPNHAPLLFVGVGKGKRTPIHPEMVKALKEK